jgi:hypothetical protein
MLKNRKEKNKSIPVRINLLSTFFAIFVTVLNLRQWFFNDNQNEHAIVICAFFLSFFFFLLIAFKNQE